MIHPVLAKSILCSEVAAVQCILTFCMSTRTGNKQILL